MLAELFLEFVKWIFLVVCPAAPCMDQLDAVLFAPTHSAVLQNVDRRQLMEIVDSARKMRVQNAVIQKVQLCSDHLPFINGFSQNNFIGEFQQAAIEIRIIKEIIGIGVDAAHRFIVDFLETAQVARRNGDAARDTRIQRTAQRFSGRFRKLGRNRIVEAIECRPDGFALERDIVAIGKVASVVEDRMKADEFANDALVLAVFTESMLKSTDQIGMAPCRTAHDPRAAVTIRCDGVIPSLPMHHHRNFAFDKQMPDFAVCALEHEFLAYSVLHPFVKLAVSFFKKQVIQWIHFLSSCAALDTARFQVLFTAVSREIIGRCIGRIEFA